LSILTRSEDGYWYLCWKVISPYQIRDGISGFIEDLFTLSSGQPTPVIASDNSNTLMVVYKRGDGLYFSISPIITINPTSFSQPQKIPGTDAYCQRPSLSYDINTNRFVLSYDRNGHIFITTYTSGTWSSPIIISDALPASNGYSCIGCTDGSGKVHCVWEGEDIFYTLPAIFHRRSVNSNYYEGVNNWSWITEFVTSEEIYKPVCGVHTDLDGGVTILLNGSSIRKIDSYNNFDWNWGWIEDPLFDPPPPSVASGFNPSIIEKISTQDNPTFIWTMYENQIYRIRYNTQTAQGKLFSSEINPKVKHNPRYSRRFLFYDSLNNALIFEIKEISQIIGKDTVGIAMKATEENIGETKKFKVRGDKVLIKLRTKKLGKGIDVIPFINIGDFKTQINLDQWVDEQFIELRVPSFLLNSETSISFYFEVLSSSVKREIIHVYFLDTSVEEYKNTLENNTADVIPPEKFNIANYPNPFNPITKIKFSLPEDSYVEIKVYDVLGREIETLLSENRKAGYHEITFDASNLPSGVYFYRIKAGKFADVKKMILMK
jgi:hypothetical protein